ncbi:hypothetical protein IAQ61_002283 [Plenodomus lingam]|uniref:uncharacterized protein n=1 Tax=Leptosphaeria maculans TaxID=5022 RepID=UPI00331D457E|nr:hypothetical protein IAQ61_002283 [Plenodomus lingam]
MDSQSTAGLGYRTIRDVSYWVCMATSGTSGEQWSVYNNTIGLTSLIHAFPNAPFKTSTQWVHDSTGANFTYVGVNWPGHGEVMIPEGLQYRSIKSIVSMIKELKMNAVRLTFAIEMIDDIRDNGGDVTVQQAFIKALGNTNGTRVWNEVTKNNPQITTSTTRLQVFDAVAAELANQQIYVHLDNHMSKGKWCCSGNDGNTWFGDTDFNVAKWERGLVHMAEHVSSHISTFHIPFTINR